MGARATNKIRLYVETMLTSGGIVEINPDDAHYLFAVMRLQNGDKISCFNEQSGEFDCSIVEIGKKFCRIEVLRQLKTAQAVPDIWLCFAPLKKDKTDFVIEKATELGIREILPVITRYTITDKVRIERFELQAKEAAEQCERTDIPKIRPAVSLEKLLDNWPDNRVLFFLDESLEGKDALTSFAQHRGQPAAILVGPEGGFCDAEKALLDSKDFVRGIALGPRILRAETAACAALSVWQAAAGDWKKED